MWQEEPEWRADDFEAEGVHGSDDWLLVVR
jgi:hypothetical protein